MVNVEERQDTPDYPLPSAVARNADTKMAGAAPSSRSSLRSAPAPPTGGFTDRGLFCDSQRRAEIGRRRSTSSGDALPTHRGYAQKTAAASVDPSDGRSVLLRENRKMMSDGPPARTAKSVSAAQLKVLRRVAPQSGPPGDPRRPQRSQLKRALTTANAGWDPLFVAGCKPRTK